MRFSCSAAADKAAGIGPCSGPLLSVYLQQGIQSDSQSLRDLHELIHRNSGKSAFNLLILATANV